MSNNEQNKPKRITHDQAEEIWIEDNPEYATCKDAIIEAGEDSRIIDYAEELGYEVIEV